MYELTRRQLLAAPRRGRHRRPRAGRLRQRHGDDTDTKKGPDYSANKEGAMDKYGVGDQFKATAPLSLSIMMLSNAAYPYNKDWPFFTELAKRTNVTLQSTVVPGSDYNQKRSVMVSSGDAPTAHPEDVPPRRRGLHRQRGDPAGQRLPRPDAELQRPDRQVETGKRHRLAAPGRRQVLPAARTARRRLARLLPRGTHRHPAGAEPVGAENVGRRAHHVEGDEGRPPRRDSRSPTGGAPHPAPVATTCSASSAKPTAPTPAGPTNRPRGTPRPASSSSPAPRTSTSRACSTSTRWSARSCSTRRASPSSTTPPGRSSPPASRS